MPEMNGLSRQFIILSTCLSVNSAEKDWFEERFDNKIITLSVGLLPLGTGFGISGLAGFFSS